MILQKNINNTLENVSLIPNILASASEYGPATRCFIEIFVNNPNLFGVYAQSLFYALHFGRPAKPSSVFGMIRAFVEKRNTKFDKDNFYLNAPNTLCAWARCLMDTNKSVEWEPVLSQLGEVLNGFLDNTVTFYNRKRINLASLLPICYDCNGFNYCTLIPHLCLITTFLTSCKAYTLSDTFSKAGNDSFKNAFEKYLTTSLAAYGRDQNVNLLADEGYRPALQKVGEESFRNAVTHILDVSKVIACRDEVLNHEEGLLKENFEEQTSLTKEDVTGAFNTVMENIVSIVINYNPIKKLVDTWSKLNTDDIDFNNLANMTSYALSGGNTMFCINNMNGYTYNLYHEGSKTDSFAFFGRQSLKSDIKPLYGSSNMPFTSNDIYLNIVSSYVKERFKTIFTDPFAGKELLNIKLDIDYTRIGNRLMDLFGQGVWLSYADSLHSYLDVMSSTVSGVIHDITGMQDVLGVYENPLAAACLPTYMVCMYPVFLLEHMKKKQPLDTFNYFEYLYNYEINDLLVSKIRDMFISLVYLDNEQYCKFVNTVSEEISKVLNEKQEFVIPFEKGLSDCAEVYAVGGIELYRFAPVPNPLVRSCEMIKNIMGTCEMLNYYEYVMSLITNPSVFEVVEGGTYDQVLKPALDKIKADTQPMLTSYMFLENGTYKLRDMGSVLNLTIGNEKITSLVIKYIYKKSVGSDISELTLYNRTVTIKNGIIHVGDIDKNKFISVDDTVSENTFDARIPLYDIHGSIKSIKVKSTKGLNKPLEIILFSPNIEENMTVWIFGDIRMNDRYEIKDKLEN